MSRALQPEPADPTTSAPEHDAGEDDAGEDDARTAPSAVRECHVGAAGATSGGAIVVAIEVLSAQVWTPRACGRRASGSIREHPFSRTSLAMARELTPGKTPEAPAAPPFKAPWSYGDVPPELS